MKKNVWRKITSARAEDHSKYQFLHVRVSLKGCNEKEFALLTGAKPEGFPFHLRALENPLQEDVRCHPAVMVSFSKKESVQQLAERLRTIDSGLAGDLEFEELLLCLRVERKIEEHYLKYDRAYTPDMGLQGRI